ncbi:Major Facilitator Superfamily protein [Pseudohyphozyma bogoriensis]|nr:Major Facilitator Superfamily protein [Pseudohyphozyma bogoriensis]
MTTEATYLTETQVSPPASSLEEKRPAEDFADASGDAGQVEVEHVYPVLSTFKMWGITLTMASAMVINIACSQCVVISLSEIQEELNIPLANNQWLASAYSLAFGSVLLLFGRLADLYGAKRVFLLGMAWFSIWSIGVGAAPTEFSIDFMRAMQGVGTGAAIPAALGILGSSFAPSQAKSTAFATFSAGAPIGGSVGNVLVLTQYAPIGWRATFYVLAGLGAVNCLAAWWFVPADPERSLENTSVDWIGAGLITSGLVLLTFALADGSSAPDGWNTPYIPTLFSVSIILLVAFWFWERYVEEKTDRVALMKTSLWFKGRFAMVQLIGALAWACFTSQLFFITLFWQDYQKLPPILVTVRFLPSCVTGVVINVIMAYAAAHIPANILITLGGLGSGLAPLLYALQDPHGSYWRYGFPAQILCVFGADFIFASGIMYVSALAGPGQQGLAGGIFNMTTQIGTAFGLAINTIIQSKVTARTVRELGGVYDPSSTNTPPEATLKGLVMAFYGCCAFAFTATVIAATCLWGIGKVGHKDVKPTIEDGVASEEKPHAA